MIYAVFYFAPIVIRLGTHIYQKTKAKKDAIKNLENMGYDVDKYYINEIFSFFKDEEEEKKYNNKKDDNECFYIPLLNWILTIYDLKYLFGNHINEPWWDNFSKMNDDKIKWLLEKNVISENKEKMQLKRDKDNALKELEKKYDNIESVKPESIAVISEKEDDKNSVTIYSSDDLKTIRRKLEKLESIITKKFVVYMANDNSDDKVENVNAINNELDILEEKVFEYGVIEESSPKKIVLDNK